MKDDRAAAGSRKKDRRKVDPKVMTIVLPAGVTPEGGTIEVVVTCSMRSAAALRTARSYPRDEALLEPGVPEAWLRAMMGHLGVDPRRIGDDDDSRLSRIVGGAVELVVGRAVDDARARSRAKPRPALRVVGGSDHRPAKGRPRATPRRP